MDGANGKSGGKYGETYEIWLSPVDSSVASSPCGGEDWSLGGARVRGEVPSYIRSGTPCEATAVVSGQPAPLAYSTAPWDPTLLTGDGEPLPVLLPTRPPSGWYRDLRGPVEVSGGRLLAAVSKCLYQILCKDLRTGLLTPDVFVPGTEWRAPAGHRKVSDILSPGVFSEYFHYSLGLLELSGVPRETLTSILRLMWKKGVIYNVNAEREVYPGASLEVLGHYTGAGDFVSAASPEALDIQDSLSARAARLGKWNVSQRWGMIRTRHAAGAAHRCLLFPMDLMVWDGIVNGTHGESLVFTGRHSSGMRWWPVSKAPRSGRALSPFPEVGSEVPRVVFKTIDGGDSDRPVIGHAPIPYDLNLCDQSATGQYSFGLLKVEVLLHTTLGTGACGGTLSTINELQGEYVKDEWVQSRSIGIGTCRGEWKLSDEKPINIDGTPWAGWARRCSFLADMLSLLYGALLVSALVQGLGGGTSSAIFTAEVVAEVVSRLAAGVGESVYGGGTPFDVFLAVAAPLHWSISRYAETGRSGAYVWRTPLRAEAGSGLVALGAMCLLASSGGSQEVSRAGATLLSIIGGTITMLGGVLGLPTLREFVGLEVRTGLADVLVLYAAMYLYGLVVQAVFLSSALSLTWAVHVTMPGAIESLSAMHAAITAARAIDKLVEPKSFVDLLESGSMKGCVSMLGGSASLKQAPSILRLTVDVEGACRIWSSPILSMYAADVYGARFGKLSDDKPPVYCLHWETARSTNHVDFDVRMGNAKSWAIVRPLIEAGTSGGTIGEASCSNAVVAARMPNAQGTGFVAVNFSGEWYPVFAGGEGGPDGAEDQNSKG